MAGICDVLSKAGSQWERFVKVIVDKAKSVAAIDAGSRLAGSCLSDQQAISGIREHMRLVGLLVRMRCKEMANAERQDEVHGPDLVYAYRTRWGDWSEVAEHIGKGYGADEVLYFIPAADGS